MITRDDDELLMWSLLLPLSLPLSRASARARVLSLSLSPQLTHQLSLTHTSGASWKSSRCIYSRQSKPGIWRRETVQILKSQPNTKFTIKSNYGADFLEFLQRQPFPVCSLAGRFDERSRLSSQPSESSHSLSLSLSLSRSPSQPCESSYMSFFIVFYSVLPLC